MPASTIWNRKPLPPSKFASLPATAIRPAGWLRDRISLETPEDLHGLLLQACLLHDSEGMDTLQGALMKRMRDDTPPSAPEIRALLCYHAVSADKEVPYFLLRYARSLRDALQAGGDMTPAEAASLGDLMYMALWLYSLTGQKAALELCRLLKEQSPDWMSTFHVFPQTKAVEAAPDAATDAFWRVHGATIAANLKTPAIQALFEGGMKNETAFAQGWEKLMRHHGAAHGLYNADPLLAGANPSRQVERGAISELLYTLSVLQEVQALAQAGDIAETIAYGPLRAATEVQAANQLVAGKADTRGGHAQFAASSWLAAADGGLAAAAYVPGEVRWRVEGSPVRIVTQTQYPYEGHVQMRVHVREPLEFSLWLRIPAWAEGAAITVGQEAPVLPAHGAYACIRRIWQDGDILTLDLPMRVRTEKRYHQSLSVAYGPLVYALPVEADTRWNVALLADPQFEVAAEAGIPVLYTDAATVPAWQRSGDMPAPPPITPSVAREDVHRIALLPYGETAARIAQFPVGILQQAE